MSFKRFRRLSLLHVQPTQIVLEPEHAQLPNFTSFLLKAVKVSTAETALSSKPFHKSPTLALMNVCPNVPFGFFEYM